MAGTRRIAAVTALARAIFRAEGRGGARGRLSDVPRMLRWGFTGRYPHLGRARMILVGVAAVLVISPVDLVPELVLPVLGLADDLVLISWAVGAVLAEIDAFAEWERVGREIIVGEVVG
jgi:uncharacterized membrane protein YkvA (DUF1232 family)